MTGAVAVNCIQRLMSSRCVQNNPRVLVRILWDGTLGNLADIYRNFGEIY